jgi:hypothetical protein
MVHPRVEQLRFARSEWQRALAGVTDEEARRRFEPMNCIAWMVGHLAWQENRYWLVRAQGKNLAPHLDALVGYGRPASTPPLAEMWSAWHAVVEAVDPFLDGLTTEALAAPVVFDGMTREYGLGSLMQRTTYHDWFHIGESQAVRQLLGHRGLPDFVGDIEREAPYRAE